MVYLTREQEKILDGERGEVLQKCYRLLVKLGDVFGADRLIPISSAHLSGISYKSIGEVGLEFLEDFSVGASFAVRTTTNPCGVDLKKWKGLGVDERFVERQLRILNMLEKMGATLTLTCTPYYIYSPAYGEHLAWAESSASCYANSVLGARTNKEAAPSALASAITGVTPNFGLHLDENRKAEVVVEVEFTPVSVSDYSVLGYVIAKRVGDKVPFIRGLRCGKDELKALGASLATASPLCIFHVDGITPEAKFQETDGLEKIEVDGRDVRSVYEDFGGEDKPEVIFIGCPHLSTNELLTLSRTRNEKIFLCTSREVCNKLKLEGQVGILCDTCPVVSPLSERYERIGVDSVKSAFYLGSKACLMRREEIIHES